MCLEIFSFFQKTENSKFVAAGLVDLKAKIKLVLVHVYEEEAWQCPFKQHLWNLAYRLLAKIN